MKNNSPLFIFTVGLIICCFVAAIMGCCSNTEVINNNTYTRLMRVVEMNKSDDCIYLIDCMGEEWIWEGIEDWDLDDYAIATLQTSSTSTIFDDSIVTLTYTLVP